MSNFSARSAWLKPTASCGTRTRGSADAEALASSALQKGGQRSRRPLATPSSYGTQQPQHGVLYIRRRGLEEPPGLDAGRSELLHAAEKFRGRDV
jgi:hypothetical protein